MANVRATEGAITALVDRTREVTTADIEHLQHVIEPSLVAGLRTGAPSSIRPCAARMR